MIDRLYGLAQPFIMATEPERAHELTLRALESGLYPKSREQPDKSLNVQALGLDFPNPLGLAAGFDKDARVPGAMLGLGFGHVEIGSVTPLPQPGNPRPRLFRLASDRAVINRMGFNGAGQEVVAERLSSHPVSGILGVNLGANKASSDKTFDFVSGIERLGQFASFITINVSSPNTPGLRDMQLPAAISGLMAHLLKARQRLTSATGRKPALVVKLAPEIAEDDLAELVATLIASGADGIALSNTTIARDGLTDTRFSREQGGLSGRPLFRRATRMLARVYLLSHGKVPLIGIGGIDSGAAAIAKIAAGATLLQLYTGLIYEGPGLVQRINRDLSTELRQRGFASLAQLRGSEAERWAHAAP